MCKAFHAPPPSSDHVCNHKDGDKRNNTPGNLEWCTPTENLRHAHTLPGRKSNAGAQFKPLCGRKVGTKEWTTYESASAAARKLGLNPGAISAVANQNGKRKKTGGYKFEYVRQYGEIEGEVWKDVILPP